MYSLDNHITENSIIISLNLNNKINDVNNPLNLRKHFLYLDISMFVLLLNHSLSA